MNLSAKKKEPLNLSLFKRRLTAFYSCWRDHKQELWGNSDVLVICTPPYIQAPVSRESISIRFLFWLLGHEFYDTLFVFTRRGIHIFCDKKTALMLHREGAHALAAEAIRAPVELRVKGEDQDGFFLMDSIIRRVRAADKSSSDFDEASPLVIGYVAGECPKSKLMRDCFSGLKPNEFQLTIVDRGIKKLICAAQEPALVPQEVETAQGLKSINVAALGENSNIRGTADRIDIRMQILRELEMLRSRLKGSVVCLNENLEVQRQNLDEYKVLVKDTEEKSDDRLPLLEKEKYNECAKIVDYAAPLTLPAVGVDSDAKKNAEASDHEDDDWVFVDGDEEGQNMKMSTTSGWKRWIVGR